SVVTKGPPCVALLDSAGVGNRKSGVEIGVVIRPLRVTRVCLEYFPRVIKPDVVKSWDIALLTQVGESAGQDGLPEPSRIAVLFFPENEGSGRDEEFRRVAVGIGRGRDDGCVRRGEEIECLVDGGPPLIVGCDLG